MDIKKLIEFQEKLRDLLKEYDLTIVTDYDKETEEETMTFLSGNNTTKLLTLSVLNPYYLQGNIELGEVKLLYNEAEMTMMDLLANGTFKFDNKLKSYANVANIAFWYKSEIKFTFQFFDATSKEEVCTRIKESEEFLEEAYPEFYSYLKTDYNMFVEGSESKEAAEPFLKLISKSLELLEKAKTDISEFLPGLKLRFEKEGYKLRNKKHDED